MHSAYFGPINSPQNDFYETSLDFRGTDIIADINTGSIPLEELQLSLIDKALDRLEDLDRTNRRSIHACLTSTPENTVRSYIHHHLSMLPKEQKQTTDESSLLAQLSLQRVGFYPHGADEIEKRAIVFDYSISPELSDELLVVYTDKHGNLSHLSHES